MSQKTPKNPGMAGSFDPSIPKAPPAGSMSRAAAARRQLEAAGDPDPDESLPEATFAAIDELYEASGRDPKIPGKL